MPLSQKLKNHLKGIVNHTSNYTALYDKMDVFIKVYTERLANYDLLPDGDLGHSIIIFKPVVDYNLSPDRPDTPKSLAQLHPGGKQEVQDKLDRLKHNRRPSIYKRKFYIYLHNEDWDNALKYHKKLSAYELDLMEEIRENAEDGGNPSVYIDDSMNGGGGARVDGENGYLRCCDITKQEYAYRKKMLKTLARVNGIVWDGSNE